MHTNSIASSLWTQKMILEDCCFAVNVIIFTKQAALLWCAKDSFFYGPNWSLSPKGFWIMQVSQVLTSHPHTAVQWKCSTERYSLQSRQDPGCSLGEQVLGHLGWRNLFDPFLSFFFQLPSHYSADREGLVTAGFLRLCACLSLTPSCQALFITELSI